MWTQRGLTERTESRSTVSAPWEDFGSHWRLSVSVGAGDRRAVAHACAPIAQQTAIESKAPIAIALRSRTQVPVSINRRLKCRAIKMALKFTLSAPQRAQAWNSEGRVPSSRRYPTTHQATNTDETIAAALLAAMAERFFTISERHYRQSRHDHASEVLGDRDPRSRASVFLWSGRGSVGIGSSDTSKMTVRFKSQEWQLRGIRLGCRS